MKLSWDLAFCVALLTTTAVHAKLIYNDGGDPCPSPDLMEYIQGSMKEETLVCAQATGVNLVVVGSSASDPTPDQQLAKVCIEPDCDGFLSNINIMDPIHCQLQSRFAWIKPLVIRLEPLCDSKQGTTSPAPTTLTDAPVPTTTLEAPGGWNDSDPPAPISPTSAPGDWNDPDSSLPARITKLPTLPADGDPFADGPRIPGPTTLHPVFSAPAPTTEAPPTPRPRSSAPTTSSPVGIVTTQTAPVTRPITPPVLSRWDNLNTRSPLPSTTPVSSTGRDTLPRTAAPPPTEPTSRPSPPSSPSTSNRPSDSHVIVGTDDLDLRLISRSRTDGPTTNPTTPRSALPARTSTAQPKPPRFEKPQASTSAPSTLMSSSSTAQGSTSPPHGPLLSEQDQAPKQKYPAPSPSSGQQSKASTTSSSEGQVASSPTPGPLHQSSSQNQHRSDAEPQRSSTFSKAQC